MTNPIEKVAVPEALQQKRRENEAAVNEALVAREGELVLVHWYDIDEHREVAMSGGLKNKYPYEARCIALGLTTGHPATSFYRNVKYQHYVWSLPVRKLWKLVLDPDMKAASKHPEGQFDGTIPELPNLWDAGRNQHGDKEFAYFPWHDSHGDKATNLGGSHLSLGKAESIEYEFGEKFGDKAHRAVQVVVGQDEVIAWLHENLERYLTTKQIEGCLIPDIYRMLGYDWVRALKAA